VEVEGPLGNAQAPKLVEANEQLVIAALRAQTDAEAASRKLDEVSRSAELDALTQLPNRVLFCDRVAQAIARAKRRATQLALLFLDLNHFKQINDTLGHAAGDEVLKLVARRLASAIRTEDTVSRHGGDEFLILLAEVSRPLDAVRIADKVIAALDAPTRVGDHVLRLSASIGISIYPDDGENAATLIDRADAAMYHARSLGPGVSAGHGQVSAGEGTQESRPLASLQQPVTRYQLALAAHERRHAELREANERLVLAALSAQELQAAAEQARRRQMEFMAIVAEELRNPLAPIRIATAMLGRPRTDEPLLPRVQAIVEQQMAQISHLVGDLLDISRAGTGALSVDRSVVDMAGIIDKAVDGCRPGMDMRLQQFEVHLPSCALEVHGDPVRLTQIVSNLLDNASKYTPDGGKIALSLAMVGDTIVMTMSDSGVGITARGLPDVFKPFAQDIHAIGFNGVGLGIGLTVVQALVEAHGGTIVASSAGSGRGSQFVVTLPLVRAFAVSDERGVSGDETGSATSSSS
jgi:diguanylate cyclase (GGDEF)-like protein